VPDQLYCPARQRGNALPGQFGYLTCFLVRARHGIGGVSPGRRHRVLHGVGARGNGPLACIAEQSGCLIAGRGRDPFRVIACLRNNPRAPGIGPVQQREHRQQFGLHLTRMIGRHRSASRRSGDPGRPEAIKEVMQLRHRMLLIQVVRQATR